MKRQLAIFAACALALAAALSAEYLAAVCAAGWALALLERQGGSR